MPASEQAAHYPAHLAEITRRHDQALELASLEHVVVLAGAAHGVFLDDSHYPYRVNPHFNAWLPLVDVPHSLVIHTPGARPRLVYYQPEDYWYQPPRDPTGFWVDHWDIQTVADAAGLARALPERPERCAIIADSQAPKLVDWGKGVLNPAPLMDFLHYHRAYKTEFELACMRAASARAALGHRAAEAAFRAGASEYRTHLAYLAACDHTDHELPYGSIVAQNRNAAVLHYQNLEREAPAEPLSFLIDAGASCSGYAADITRTYARHPGEFADLITAMDRLQQAICAKTRVGVDYRDLNLEAHHALAQVLNDSGLIELDNQSAVTEGVTRTFLPHGLGHLLGLQVHDVGGFMAGPDGGTIPPPPDHPFLRLTRSLEPNQVLTIEPGLYFIDSLLRTLAGQSVAKHINWDRVEALKSYGGIRVEDNIHVTAQGPENLTRAHL